MSNRYALRYDGNRDDRVIDVFLRIAANFPLDVVKTVPNDMETGVYFGWANVDNGPVYKAVLNMGWCPFYENKEKSVV